MWCWVYSVCVCVTSFWLGLGCGWFVIVVVCDGLSCSEGWLLVVVVCALRRVVWLGYVCWLLPGVAG